MLQAWLRLCLLIYQGPGPAVATQPTAEDAAAWKTRDRYLDYVDAVIGAADAEISADAGDERKVPWLACDRGWRGNPANRHLRPDWRRPGPRSPWTSHRGGIRAGETDCDAAGFCEKYHQQTIDLLIDLAHRNRAGRFARLQALIKPPDPAHATADPTTDPVECG